MAKYRWELADFLDAAIVLTRSLLVAKIIFVFDPSLMDLLG